MAELNHNSPVCVNGHQQPSGGSRFCIYCGVTLAVPAAASAAPAVPAVHPQANFPQPVPHVVPVPQYPQYPMYQPPLTQSFCRVCGGHGEGLSDGKVICAECGWLRPLVPGYQVDTAAFAWSADAKAMAALRAIKPLNAAAKAVSEKVGRRWVEAAFNGVRLSERQLPQIYGSAIRAARLLGMSHMPDVYLSGDRAWDCLTFGSNRDSFIVIGSALAGNFQGVDMLFLLAREMGHCKAGHALWKTVIRFFLGEQGPSKGFMAGGIFNAILNPTHLLTGAIEMPLLAWARQAEITADRAGLLAVGSEEVARRVLLSWSLRSSVMFRQINIVEWLEQQSEEDDNYTKLSELTTSSTPYLGPRMKLLARYAQSPELKHYVASIKEMVQRSAPPKPAAVTQSGTPSAPAGDQDVIRLKCSSCGAAMRIPKSVLAGKTKLSIKCPSAGCGKFTVITKKPKSNNSKNERTNLIEENQNDGD